ncbi:MAG: hypothetical protein ABIS86_09750 [Streptosporangiaceae bacterium]
MSPLTPDAAVSAQYRNPFEYPGYAGEPAPALDCPCESRETCDHYLDVDSHHEQLELFDRILADAVAGLDQRGLFVPVGGPQLSGRTSLINRCARMVQSGEGGPRWAVYDLTGVAKGSLTSDRRLEKIANTFLSRLRVPSNFYADQLQLLPDSVTSLDDLLESVSNLLPTGQALILKMPPALIPPDIAGYWAATKKKMVVFAQCANSEVSELARTLKSDGDTKTLYLKTDVLRAGDVRKLLAARTESGGAGVDFPEVDYDSLLESAGALFQTVGSTQTFLFRFYERYRNRTWDPEQKIGEAEISEFIFEVLSTAAQEG